MDLQETGTEPVLLSTVNPDTRVKVASNLLHDYGYFNGNVTYQVDKYQESAGYQADLSCQYGATLLSGLHPLSGIQSACRQHDTSNLQRAYHQAGGSFRRH